MKTPKLIMISGALLILALFLFPLWNITLEAPQYPTPLGMDIYINDFSDAHPHDIKNINLMNHYVGMQYIPETIPEFKIFPWVVGIMAALGVLIGLFANYKWYLGWFVLMSVFAIAGIYDFYLWEYDYGHNLDPKAIMKFTNPDGSIMGFQPPLFGSKDILNFKAHSYPQLGAYLMALGMALTFIAYILGKKDAKKYLFTPKSSLKKTILTLFSLALLFTSCNTGPKAIDYGIDGCHFCEMTIVDKLHAAEIVTKKGKIYKFDATECMINNLKDMDIETIDIYLSTDYNEPEALIDASQATFLISKEIPSPMGAYLSAFKHKEDAVTKQKEKGGELYTWQELLTKLKR
ncbi:nitrous oxide reductase accessory protein NosL [Aquimarina sediminis]|uniref:nitrous oxide reductase accessory protein NosL n=1 Tax=Aquimarina sediminis TaxID=2070536 RepID=UPI0029374528|nr:nitrous oxide reductase accessory protein NosL [Aquimarina sediminis]